jgi:formylglycine-generating enzyme required for sulfatase activity
MMPNPFPLAGFLQWLQAVEGLDVHITLRDYRRIQRVLLSDGEWTHTRLQQVLAALLAHSHEQQVVFAQAYRQFFAVPEADNGIQTPLDIGRIRQELQWLGQRSSASLPDGLLPDPQPAATGGDVALPRPWWKGTAFRWVMALVLGLLLVFGGQATYHYLTQPGNTPVQVDTTPKPVVPANKPISEQITIKPGALPTPAAETSPPASTAPALWWWLLPLAGLGFTAYAGYQRWQLERIPRLPAAPPTDTAGKAYFDPALVGGRMPEWLDKDTLDYCADSVGFFITEDSSHEPDMPATIRATAEAGGIPHIRLLRHKQLFHLLVLVDDLAEGVRWNPVAEELANGLRRRGLPVTVGHLQGNLREFHTDEGRHWTLRELGEERGHYVVVVFAEAGLLDRQKDRDVLEELQQWPQLAWLAFREQRHWGGAEQVLQQHGVHLWEASPRHLPEVFRHLAGEMLRYSLPQLPARQWLAQQPHEPLASYLPRVLGDALPLARLAALFPPPLSPALLVRLALAFFPHLPLLRVQRLYRVAGSRVEAGGLSLPVATLQLLRGQFLALHSDAQRRKVIDTLLEWMQEAEPEDKDKHSPAWWAWRWRYARLLAELDADRGYPLLEAVERSGLFAEGVAADLDSLPVSRPPQQASTLKNLYLLGKRHGYTLLDKAQALPGSAFWQRAVQAGSLATLLLAVVLGGWQFWPALQPGLVKQAATVPTQPQQLTPPTSPSAPPITAKLPAMVTIPTGTFDMGCVENSGFCQDNEKPVHSVSVPAFDMGAYEVTVGQFKAFVDATGYQTTAEQQGSCISYDASGNWNEVKGNSWRKTDYTQTDYSPVTCVSWQDAQAYLKWLSGQTQQQWRLPTEAEWEYAARGGTKTAYSWGDQEPVCDTQAANGAQFSDCKEKAPLKVGRFKPNPFGLYDVHGNVWEWVEDCYNNDYQGAPADGSARQGCDANASRVLRGGSWNNSEPWTLRSAYRFNHSRDNRNNSMGFRAARTINPLPSTGKGAAGQVAQAPQQGQAAPGTSPKAVQDTQKVPAPAMLPIPAGKFTMGCDPKRDDVEGGCYDDEKPPHEVSVPSFWLAATDVTVAQYMACVDAGGCPAPAWKEKGNSYNIDTGTDDLYKKMGEVLTGKDYPIVGVSWNDAQAYVQWLSQQTGKHYRLPTEAEWEYAARAGTDTAYPWGNAIGKDNANCSGDLCGDKFSYTSPVGSFAANPFGLYDMNGNVYQWVEDCWQGDYKGAPVDGSARQGCGANASRVLRGGSWYYEPWLLRSANRYDSPDFRYNDVGFRAARIN